MALLVYVKMPYFSLIPLKNFVLAFRMKVSGSLYGALFGSLIVYPLADFLGTLFE